MTTPTIAVENTEAAIVEDHRVRLVFKVPATNPRDAVESVIEQLVEHGLRTWTFHVENLSTNAQFYVDGFGKVDLVEDVLAEMDAAGYEDEDSADDPINDD